MRQETVGHDDVAGRQARDYHVSFCKELPLAVQFDLAPMHWRVRGLTLELGGEFLV